MKKRALAIVTVIFIAFSFVSCSSQPYNYDLSKYITLGQYKGIEIPLADLEDELQMGIDKLLQDNSDEVEITDRPAKMGDLVNIDFTGYIDGIPFDGGSSANYDLVLGDNVFIDGFEDGIVGHNPGDTFDVMTVFPEDYKNNTDLAGKDAKFTITLNSVAELIIPELTDAFIAEKSSYSTLEEYKKETTITLRRNYVWNTAVGNSTLIEYPKAQVKEYYDGMLAYYEAYANQMGAMLTDFVQSALGQSMESFLKETADYATNQVKQEMVAYSIAKAENIDISNDEYNDLLETYAAKLGYETVAELKAGHPKKNIKMNMMMDKIIEFTLSSAVDSTAAAE